MDVDGRALTQEDEARANENVLSQISNEMVRNFVGERLGLPRSY